MVLLLVGQTKGGGLVLLLAGQRSDGAPRVLLSCTVRNPAQCFVCAFQWMLKVCVFYLVLLVERLL